ncbi:MAG: hypothetical protein HOC91_12720 [Nitrospinaceae bacterium]|jgi:hypothetical protein|nr:hypothetical protein [Nitrospinaceae bacterium]MBT3433373.1 hypothetical protein [Nitrospinaceae bacterium]MBT3820484.1 hypothetical protein [Nitrospinaceae bacterium]MBT4095343.1 hypothetical protein [Nitrospinaceae bacterium]MBT4431373.1 hypothetical protein [Nitrospinaceae bacterium]
MSEERRRNVISVDESHLEQGDLLPESLQASASEASSSKDLLTEQEFAMCDGEGGSAPSKGTRCA